MLERYQNINNQILRLGYLAFFYLRFDIDLTFWGPIRGPLKEELQKT